MNVLTSGKIEYKSNACGCMSGIDGSNKSSVQQFQVWANMYHSAQLVTDGIYGPLTKAAYNKWGEEWEKTQTATNTPSSPTAPPLREGVVTANKDGVNVYDLNNKVLKVAKKGEYVGTIQGDADKDWYYVNTSFGKGKVVKANVDVAKSNKPTTPSVPTTPTTPAPTETTAPTFMEKVRALPVPAKIGIGLGLTAVLGIIIWKLIPKK